MAEQERKDVWTFASANSITTPGNLTGTYWPGMKVALKQGTIKYFEIVSVTYAAPNTTIVLDGFGIYTLTSATITAHIDTTEAAPKGFPIDLAKISIASDGTLYCIANDKILYAWNGASWDSICGDCKAVSALSATEAYVIGIDNCVWKWTAPSTLTMIAALP